MYIAVDLKVIEGLAGAVARAAAVNEDRVLAGLVRLWHRVWCDGSDSLSCTALAGVVGGERLNEVIGALVEFGFLEPAGDAYRVRGAERYLRLKESRRAGARATNAKRSKSDALERSGATLPTTLNDALPPSTEHRAPNKRKKPRAASAPPPDPRHAPLVKALVDACPGYAFTPRDAGAVKQLLAKAEPAEIELRWKRALARSNFPTVRAIHELAAFWPHFAADSPTRDVTRGMAGDKQTYTDAPGVVEAP